MIDLHTHTTASDGVLTPIELIKLARKQGLKAISITDHDTVKGIIKTELIEVVPGVEISTTDKREEVHILGYYIDTKNKQLLEKLEYLKKKRLTRADEMLKKLRSKGITLKKEEIEYKESIGRPNIARALITKGHAKTIKEAFNKYLGTKGTAYVEKKKLGYEQAIKTIKQAGGIPFLAHPGEIKTNNIKEYLDRAVKKGVKGIEVIHPSNNKEMRELLKNYCKKNKLLISGGSDYHGKGRKNKLAKNIPYSYLEKIKELKKEQQE